MMPFAGPELAGDDEVVTAQIEILERERHERQQRLVAAGGTRDALQEGRGDLVSADFVGDGGGVVDEREYIGVGIKIAQGFDDLFATPHGYKPIMYNRYAHDIFLRYPLPKLNLCVENRTLHRRPMGGDRRLIVLARRSGYARP